MSLVTVSASTGTNGHPVYLITLSSPPDHRLSPALIAEFHDVLDSIEADWRAKRKEAQQAGDKKKKVGGTVIIRGEGEKFFSNGLDFVNAIKDPMFHPNIFNKFILRVLTFPLITVAAINGHCFAGGYLLAMACDFRVMRDESPGRRAWCCMNEIDFGAPYPPVFATLLRVKLPANVLHPTMLGHRFTAPELHKAGVLEALASSHEALLEEAHKVAERWGAKPEWGVWGQLKTDVYQPIIQSAHDPMPPMPTTVDQEADKRLANVKSKL